MKKAWWIFCLALAGLSGLPVSAKGVLYDPRIKISVNGISLGMPHEEVRVVLGDPDHIGRYEDGDGYFFERSNIRVFFDKKGLVREMVGTRLEKNGRPKFSIGGALEELGLSLGPEDYRLKGHIIGGDVWIAPRVTWVSAHYTVNVLFSYNGSSDEIILASEEESDARASHLAQVERSKKPSYGRREILLEVAPAAKVMEKLKAEYPNVKFFAHPSMNGFYISGSRKDALSIKAAIPDLDKIPFVPSEQHWFTMPYKSKEP